MRVLAAIPQTFRKGLIEKLKEAVKRRAQSKAGTYAGEVLVVDDGFRREMQRWKQLKYHRSGWTDNVESYNNNDDVEGNFGTGIYIVKRTSHTY